MLDNFKDTGWVDDLRVIDSYVDVEPSIKSDCIVERAIIKSGGFNNTIWNIKNDLDETGIMVALSRSYSGVSKYSTNNGRNWYNTDLPSNIYWTRCKYLNNVFFALGYTSVNSSNVSVLFYSYDGIKWEEVSNLSGIYNDIAYGSGGMRKYAMIGNNGAFAYSSDGIEWTQTTISSSYKYILDFPDTNEFLLIPNDTTNYMARLTIENGEIYKYDISYNPYTSKIGYYSEPVIGTLEDGSNNGKVYIMLFYNTGTASSPQSSRYMIRNAEQFLLNHWEIVSVISGDFVPESTLDYSAKGAFGNNTYAFKFAGDQRIVFFKDGESKYIESTNYLPNFNLNDIVFQYNKFFLFSNTDNSIYYIEKMTEIVSDFSCVKVNSSGYAGNSAILSAQNLSFDGLLTYDPNKMIGYFDDSNTSIKLSTYSLASNNIEYSSAYITDDVGNVISTDNGNAFVEIMLLTNSKIARYFEIVGDVARGEYPVDFDIVINSGDDMDFSEGTRVQNTIYNIKNNNLVHCFIDFGEDRVMPEYVTVRIRKWSTPYSSVKLNYVGFALKYAFSKHNVLKDFSLHQKLKNNDSFGYGIRYGDASLNVYNDEYSRGYYLVDYGVFDGETQVDFYTKKLKPLNILNILSEAQFNNYFKFYVKTYLEPNYRLIGRYYSNKVEYDTQGDFISIQLNDVMQKIQSIEYGGPSYKLTYNGIKSDSLTNVLNCIKSDLLNVYGLKFDTTNSISNNVTIGAVVFTSDTLWELLEQCCNVGMFYIVANHTNEDSDFIIVDRR